MVGTVRDRMIDTASELLARRGLQATTFPEVLALSGAPRGSIYHHFPGGRAELIDAALDNFAQRIVQGLATYAGDSPAELTAHVVAFFRGAQMRRDCEASCPVGASVVGADSSAIELRCRDAFNQMQGAIARGYVRCGVAEATADELATLVFASMQGAMVMARAAGSIDRFDVVGAGLVEHVRLRLGKAG